MAEEICKMNQIFSKRTGSVAVMTVFLLCNGPHPHPYVIIPIPTITVIIIIYNQVGGVVATIFLLCVALIAITLNLQPPNSSGWQSLPSYDHHIVISTLNIQPPQINFVIHHHRFWSQLQPAELEQILA